MTRTCRPGQARRRWAGPAAGYSSAVTRAYLRKRGIKAVIPAKEDQSATAPAAARAAARPAFDAGRYKARNTVERCFSKCKQFRAVAPRYDKREPIYQGTVDVASIRSWLRDPVP